ncbi:hypothetical protein E1293_46045 [Actinomadura darangshiensis]|uniref:Uncharacterized protein n=1 Tax=Actinomadura darangshiensis TaxID=705336 RepID=A0A4R4ZMX2_9ACTN|nr:hypothetical protein [Actinomadura darangshiensis]TDD59945.1 hypothetical protein E1293_46045 [Actinomadura darangshiensis]
MPNPVTCWYGKATGSWWAVARDGAGRWRLVEAASQAELGRRLTELGAHGYAALAQPILPSRSGVPPVQSAARPNHAPRHHY